MSSFELAVIEWPEGPGTSAPLVVARSQNPVLLELVLRRLRSSCCCCRCCARNN